MPDLMSMLRQGGQSGINPSPQMLQQWMQQMMGGANTGIPGGGTPIATSAARINPATGQAEQTGQQNFPPTPFPQTIGGTPSELGIGPSQGMQNAWMGPIPGGLVSSSNRARQAFARNQMPMGPPQMGMGTSRFSGISGNTGITGGKLPGM